MLGQLVEQLADLPVLERGPRPAEDPAGLVVRPEPAAIGVELDEALPRPSTSAK